MKSPYAHVAIHLKLEELITDSESTICSADYVNVDIRFYGFFRRYVCKLTLKVPITTEADGILVCGWGYILEEIRHE